jgi:hypothetical protein
MESCGNLLDNDYFFCPKLFDNFIFPIAHLGMPIAPARDLTSVADKSHITKVMFLSALARPRFNYATCQWF